MALRKSTIPTQWSMQEVLEHVGGVSARRVPMHPTPGTATEKDVLRFLDRENRLFELVDGILVEKVMGLRESGLAQALLRPLGNHVEQHDLGFVAGQDGTVRLMPGLIRIPDGSFISWKQLPSKHYPDEPIPDLAPELAVEVLSRGNTPQEMALKLKDYCFAGVKLVWFIDPERKTVTAYTAPDQAEVFREGDVLHGGNVLPGFTLPLRDLFDRVGSGKGKPGKGQKGKKNHGK